MAYETKFDGNTDTVISLGDKTRPTETASIEGYFLGTKEIPDQGYGPGKLHIFQTPEGTVGVWGKTNSNRLLTSDLKGQMCLLTFTGMGEKKKGKNPAYNYSLQHDPVNKISVEGINLNASEPSSDDNDVDADAFDAPEEAPTYTSKTPPKVSKQASPQVVTSAPPSNSAAKIKLDAMIAARRA